MKCPLALAVATFVLLDLGSLAFSYSIARQVEKDAVAINLAGRQRMLSQSITKAALLSADQERSEQQRVAAAAEMMRSYEVFRRTLNAFADGGETSGGDGHPVQLEAVQGKAALVVGNVRGALGDWPQVPLEEAALSRFVQFMVERNGDILEAMNQLTSELEHQSIATVSRLRLAQALAFALSLANFIFILRQMRRAQLQAEIESETDALTGLLNRGGFYRKLNEALVWRSAANESLGVMLLDLDDFKAVNDRFGHAAGDATLREVARRLQALMRHHGWICGRLGGDEFAVICRGSDAEMLGAAAEQTSRILSGIPGGEMVISASVGFAAVQSEKSADEVMAEADAMMYAVKASQYPSGAYRDRRRQAIEAFSHTATGMDA